MNMEDMEGKPHRENIEKQNKAFQAKEKLVGKLLLVWFGELRFDINVRKISKQRTVVCFEAKDILIKHLIRLKWYFP
jgi:hypothetical protein